MFYCLALYMGLRNVYDACKLVGMIYIIFADIIIVAVMIYDRYEKDFIMEFILLLIAIFVFAYL